MKYRHTVWENEGKAMGQRNNRDAVMDRTEKNMRGAWERKTCSLLVPQNQHCQKERSKNIPKMTIKVVTLLAVTLVTVIKLVVYNIKTLLIWYQK